MASISHCELCEHAIGKNPCMGDPSRCGRFSPIQGLDSNALIGVAMGSGQPRKSKFRESWRSKRKREEAE